MIHVCLMKGIPLSPYVAFTGSFKDFQRLDTVADLPHKVTAAVDAGMRVLFVPQGNFAALSEDEPDVARDDVALALQVALEEAMTVMAEGVLPIAPLNKPVQCLNLRREVHAVWSKDVIKRLDTEWACPRLLLPARVVG
jgi:hypothetical protein